MNKHLNLSKQNFLEAVSIRSVYIPFIVVVVFVLFTITVMVFGNRSANTYSTALNDYTAKVKSSKINDSKDETDGSVSEDFVSKVNNPPKLNYVFLGDIFSGQYKSAKNKSDAISYYQSVATLSKQRAQFVKNRDEIKSENSYREKYPTIINPIIRNANATSPTKVDPTRGFDVTKDEYVSYYQTLESGFSKSLNEMKKVSVPASQKEPAAFFRYSVEKSINHYKKYKELYQRATTFGDIQITTRLLRDDKSNTLRLQRAQTVLDDNLYKRSLEEKSLQSTILEDLPNITERTNNPRLTAKFDYLKQYAAQASSFEGSRDDNDYRRVGDTKYALYQIEQELYSSSTKSNLRESLLKQHDNSLNAIAWIESEYVEEDAEEVQTDAIKDIFTYTGYGLQSKYLFDGPTYKGNTVDIKRMKNIIKQHTLSAYPPSPKLNSQIAEVNKEYEKILDFSFTFFEEAEPLNKQIRSVVSEAYELSKKPALSEKEKQKATDLAKEITTLQDKYDKLGDDFSKKVTGENVGERLGNINKKLLDKADKYQEDGAFKKELKKQFSIYSDATN